jgi:hypothetical protein
MVRSQDPLAQDPRPCLHLIIAASGGGASKRILIQNVFHCQKLKVSDEAGQFFREEPEKRRKSRLAFLLAATFMLPVPLCAHPKIAVFFKSFSKLLRVLAL